LPQSIPNRTDCARFSIPGLCLQDVTITEGPGTNERQLEQLWARVLPALAPQLRRLAMAFEGYGPRGPPDEEQVRRSSYTVMYSTILMYRGRVHCAASPSKGAGTAARPMRSRFGELSTLEPQLPPPSVS
jgi:hypothetical protein